MVGRRHVHSQAERAPAPEYGGCVQRIPSESEFSIDEMLADLRELVEVESPSLDVDAVSASAKVLAAIIERRLGGTASLVDSSAGPHVHWVGGGDPKVLLLGHHDTVFPMGTLAARPFEVVDGRATGPGVFDMLGGIVQALHGLAASTTAPVWSSCSAPMKRSVEARRGRSSRSGRSPVAACWCSSRRPTAGC